MAPLSLSGDIESVLAYLRHGIQARERVKFIFTKNLSAALDQVTKHGQTLGLDREALSFLRHDDFLQLRNGHLSAVDLTDLITMRRKHHTMTQLVELPRLIFSDTDFHCFERGTIQANYISQQTIQAPLIVWSEGTQECLEGCIVMIRQADPGYDWLFTKNIAGLITAFGGANSHMAIRAAEMNLPPAIGIGEAQFELLSHAKKVTLDCQAQQIRQLT